ncbi:MAG: condensation domain-containing protein, partial [Bifidobacteriaceae bacterium]|nr:condensation domain-containing protein [Bifidobacteriaceae bacterium]
MAPHMGNRVECVRSLTPLQAGMLFDAQLHPDSHAYRLQELIDVRGPLNLAAAAEALAPLAARHQALRTAIIVPAASGTPRQVFLRDRRPGYMERDLTGLDPAAADAAIEAARVADLAHGYDLKKDPLARLTVFRLTPDHAILMWSFDHIVVDGWSMPIVLSDYLRYYTALTSGQSLDHVTHQATAEAAATTSYTDYLDWCAAHPTDQDLPYWRDLLAGYEMPATFTDLGLGDPATQVQSETARADIDPRTAEALTNFARAHRLTPASALTAAWGLVLARQARTDDVVYGQVRSGRDIELDGLDRAVGMFINTVPVRLTVTPGETLGRLLEGFSRQQIDSGPHGRTPLADIQHLTPLGADLISTLGVVENYYVDPAATAQSVGDLQFQLRTGREQTQYPIVMRTPGHDFVETLYDPRVYSREEARLLAARTVRVLDQAVTHPDLPCSQLDLLLPGERETVIGRFSPTPPPGPHPQTLAGTFTHFATAQPDRPALLFRDRSVTYRELDHRTNQIARALQHMGAGPEKIVAIIARRGIGQTAAQIAVAKSGAAYLPIDADYPAARQQYLLQDAKPIALITSDAIPNTDPTNLGIPVLDLQKDRTQIDAQDQGPLPETSGPENLAYVIYTSGTTGQPKGVMVEQRQIAAFCAAMQQNLQPYLKDDDVVDLFCRYVFDASFQELAIGVFGGRTQCLIPEELFDDETAFSDYLVSHGVTVAFYSPAYFRQIT